MTIIHPPFLRNFFSGYEYIFPKEIYYKHITMLYLYIKKYIYFLSISLGIFLSNNLQGLISLGNRVVYENMKVIGFLSIS